MNFKERINIMLSEAHKRRELTTREVIQISQILPVFRNYNYCRPLRSQTKITEWREETT